MQMLDLKMNVEELHMENEYQLRLKDMSYNEKIRELTANFNQQIHSLKTRLQVCGFTASQPISCALHTLSAFTFLTAGRWQLSVVPVKVLSPKKNKFFSLLCCRFKTLPNLDHCAFKSKHVSHISHTFFFWWCALGHFCFFNVQNVPRLQKIVGQHRSRSLWSLRVELCL